jgi:hypothetical protein
MKMIQLKDGQALPWLEAIRANAGPLELEGFRGLQAGKSHTCDDATAEWLIEHGFCFDVKGGKDGDDNVE